jgi:hypothetical protein
MVKVNNEIRKIFSEVGFFEKTYCFYKKHARKIWIAFSFLFLAVLITGGVKIYSDFKLKKIQCDYVNLLDNVDKLAFTKKYKCTFLSGLVLLELGDDAFRECDYKAASFYYGAAGKILKKTELAVRALISHAVSLFISDEQEAGLVILDQIIHDKSLGNHLKSEALYRYICCAKVDGNNDKINEILCYIDGHDVTERWRERLNSELK